MLAITGINAYRGYGQHYGHRFGGGGGIMFGAHLLTYLLIALVGFVALAFGTAWANQWADRRYPGNNFRLIAGWVMFLLAILVLLLLVTRVI